MTFWPSWKKEKGAFPGSDRLSLIGSWLYVLSYQRINYKASKVGNIKLHQPRSKAEFDGTLAWEITSPWSSSSSESNKALHGPLFKRLLSLPSTKKQYMECMKWLELLKKLTYNGHWFIMHEMHHTHDGKKRDRNVVRMCQHRSFNMTSMKRKGGPEKGPCKRVIFYRPALILHLFTRNI